MSGYEQATNMLELGGGISGICADKPVTVPDKKSNPYGGDIKKRRRDYEGKYNITQIKVVMKLNLKRSMKLTRFLKDSKNANVMDQSGHVGVGRRRRGRICWR